MRSMAFCFSAGQQIQRVCAEMRNGFLLATPKMRISSFFARKEKKKKEKEKEKERKEGKKRKSAFALQRRTWRGERFTRFRIFSSFAETSRM